jgi:hypothetical protein
MKFKFQLSNGKIICSIFWDNRGAVHVNILELGYTVISACSVETLKKVKIKIARGRTREERKLSPSE